MRAGWLFLPAGLLVACAETPPAPAPDSAPAHTTAPEPAVEREEPIKSQPLRHLAGRNLKPMPVRPLNVKSQCSHRDAVGTQTRLNLLVKEAQVKTFSAQVIIPKRGVCRFDLKNFQQTATLPQALLKAKDGSNCSVRLWEQGREVTIAFNSCSKACEGEAFNYLWPILVDAKTGRCT
ncbi:MAG: hypothetical protein JNK96_14280 [Betaproteobacteria bacterium]|jgi:hypothetical protein|nr:hypothetical protein [Betaproteobacteria bacterium]HMV19645.1 hypothetical protein [Rhodocyclaceae bacterium]HMW76367.1 hypothetical protein [Rhodocyclaceae bacterium]HNE41935.1 hypothetical protein [Rhodocyclaceae bacterium]HNL22833.1 hypothetical protein [Rhodocyclaceae bacterium]